MTFTPYLSEVLPGLLIVCPADAPEHVWSAERLNGIGGSDIAAAVGINKYATPYTLWAQKTGRVDPAPDEDARERMRVGHLLEPVCRAEFARRHPEYRVTTAEGTYAVPGALWQRVNVDGLVWDRATGELVGVLECKAGTHWQLEAWEADEVPVAYTAQGQWACHVTGAERVFYMALLDSLTFVEKTIDRDDLLIHDLLDIATDLWQHVQTDTMPPVDGTAVTKEALKRIAAVDGKRIDLDPSWHKGLRRRRELFEQAKEIETEIDEIGNQLRAVMGDATEAYLDGQLVATHRASKPRTCRHCGHEGKAGRRLTYSRSTTTT